MNLHILNPLRSFCGLLLCILIIVSLSQAQASDLPTAEEFAAVTRAHLLLPSKCEAVKYPESHRFLNQWYFDYDETKFQASFDDGAPKLRFYAKDKLIKEIIMEQRKAEVYEWILEKWGFVPNKERAEQVRNEIWRTAHSGDPEYHVTPLEPLKLDENGNLLNAQPVYGTIPTDEEILAMFGPSKVVSTQSQNQIENNQNNNNEENNQKNNEDINDKTKSTKTDEKAQPLPGLTIDPETIESLQTAEIKKPSENQSNDEKDKNDNKKPIKSDNHNSQILPGLTIDPETIEALQTAEIKKPSENQSNQSTTEKKDE